MKIFASAISVVSMVTIVGNLATFPVAAQERGFMPPTQLHAVNPSM